MLWHFRRREIPWEVVDRKAIKPVFYEGDDDDEGPSLPLLPCVAVASVLTQATDIDIASVSDADTSPAVDDAAELRKAVVFARQQLLQTIQKKNFNALLSESWNLTILRRGKRHRVQVEYTGRPARLVGKVPALRPPPFIQIL
ncbi:hypothetical protein FB45DRAFT_916325 [Roridomyces roridus]|uniref:Uncharacterized protein n=1 Tax=Roridomyces roridus TaxID=1738132 RepID=A0AAD7BUD7_9AGAR|nr:hypothetical protein FB45DRAFT_916325 [Roridomyces roridus]